jgi:hypothetical protein
MIYSDISLNDIKMEVLTGIINTFRQELMKIWPKIAHKPIAPLVWI